MRMRSLLGIEDIQDSDRMGIKMDFRDDDGEWMNDKKTFCDQL